MGATRFVGVVALQCGEQHRYLTPLFASYSPNVHNCKWLVREPRDKPPSSMGRAAARSPIERRFVQRLYPLIETIGLRRDDNHRAKNKADGGGNESSASRVAPARPAGLPPHSAASHLPAIGASGARRWRGRRGRGSEPLGGVLIASTHRHTRRGSRQASTRLAEGRYPPR